MPLMMSSNVIKVNALQEHEGLHKITESISMTMWLWVIQLNVASLYYRATNMDMSTVGLSLTLSRYHTLIIHSPFTLRSHLHYSLLYPMSFLDDTT